MDINSLLPLLLSGSGNADKAKLFAMLTGGKSAEEAVTETAGPEMSGLMNMLMQSRQKPRAAAASGLGVISPFAPAEIIGALVKLLGAG